MSWFKKWGNTILGGIETVFDVAADFIPGGGAIKKGKKALKKWAKVGARATAIGVGTAKDVLLDMKGEDLSGLADEFGDYKRVTDKKMGDMEKGLQVMGDRIGGLEKGLKGMGDCMGNLEGQIKGLGDRTGTLERGMGSLKEGLDSVRSDLEGVKSEIETQGHELRQAMGEMKSEL